MEKGNKMVNYKTIQQQIINIIKKYGSKGIVRRTVTTGVEPRNSYDENGEEIAVSDTGKVQEQEVLYIHKRLKAKELKEGSLNDEYTRFTLTSQSQLGEDTNRLTVLKGDIFIDAFGVDYSIEKVDHVGQMRNREMLIEVIARRA